MTTHHMVPVPVRYTLDISGVHRQIRGGTATVLECQYCGRRDVTTADPCREAPTDVDA